MTVQALIGHTGFVGGTLLQQGAFNAVFNSRNIDEIRSRYFDIVICAGVSAVKWLANKDPEADRARIAKLTDALETVTAGHFVLISTVDVYGNPIGVTENDRPLAAGLHPYGLHRLELEDFVAARFPRATIIRLPALFGTGLKKNAVFDLITGNMVDRIVPNAAFQWYPLRRLTQDIETILDAGVPLINITAEPIRMDTIRDRFFDQTAIAEPVARPPLYDLRSMHARLFGAENDLYHFEAETVLHEMDHFIQQSRR